MTKINYKSYKICMIIIFISLLVFFVKREETISICVGGEAVITTFSPIKINAIENKEIVEFNEVDSNTVKVVGNSAGTANVNLSLGGIQIKDVNINVTDEIYLIPGGETLGIRINTKGVLVLGTGYVNGIDTKVYRPVDNIIKAGDIINKVNGVDVETKEQFIELIQSEEAVNIQITRDGKEKDVVVTPVKAVEDEKYKVGLWVRDSTQGIGTLTYYNPTTLEFVSLGHGITDVDTKSLMTVKDGSAFLSDIVSVNKGKKGLPGELIGEIKIKNEIGKVISNKDNGVHGILNNVEDLNNRLYGAIPICKMENVKVGEATILSNINGTNVVEYDIYIDSINKSNKENKNMVIKVTDTRLLEDTNGIVQGMSGSPIIQNGKLVGAVTHVFVQDPTKGYGIFIENMMD